MIRTQIQLTEEQSLRLKILAEKEQISVAELIRRSVDSYLEDIGEPSSQEREKQLLSIIGIVKSGPTDLSENHDEYLVEGYAEVGE